MRRSRLAAVLLHLLAGAAALPTLQPELLHTEQLELQTNAISDGVTVNAELAAGAPGRTLAALETVGPLSEDTGPASEAEGVAYGAFRPVSDSSSETVDPLDEADYADEDSEDLYEVARSSSEAPGRPAAVTEAPPGPELTSAATSGQHCPSQCVCFDLTVDCSSRDLRQLPAALPNWTNVLDLHDNLLESLPRAALASMPHLKVINVNRNARLKYLAADTFADNLLLDEIDLSGCSGLGAVPPLELPPTVRVVDLSDTGIEQLEAPALLGYGHVHNLDLSDNRITGLPRRAFPDGSQLRRLKLHNNRISSPRELRRLRNLRHLEVLKLSKNRISRLKKDMFRGLGQLRELDLNRNRLSEIDSLVFSGLHSLQVLKLKRNGIRRLMDGAFYHLHNMTQLYLDHNQIRNITKGWLFGLKPLERFSLSHNELQRTDLDCWRYCEHLAFLDLSYNQLSAVDTHTFAKLPRLQQLVLDHNRIALIDENALRGSPKLRDLELNNNLISSTIEEGSGAFSGLHQLTRVGLRHNRIMSVSADSFTGADALEEIDLAGNPLTTVREASFSRLTALRVLVIDSQSLLCDCTLRWLPTWVREAGHAQTVTARCHHPQRLQGQPLLEVAPDSLACHESPKPAIRLQPRTGKTLKGDNLTLSCEAESSANDTMQFDWRKDSQLVEAGRAVSLAWAHTDGRPGLVMRSELSLVNLTDADAGEYQCVVSNGYGVSYSSKARVDVHVFPVFQQRPADLQLRAGNTARLDCKAFGQPTPSISWEKDGGSDFPAASQRRLHMLETEDGFYIVKVQADDQGTYTCTARNEAGEIRANATLSVLEAPSFVQPMEDREVPAGDTAVLTCMAAGSPAPRLTWTKDGAPLQLTERHFFTAGQQLLIIVQTVPEDAGRYQCQMNNVLGEQSGLAKLTVLPSSSLGLDDDSTYAIIIIAVVSGVVVTSLVWVIIIYQARKRSLRQQRNRSTAADRPLSPPPPHTVTVYHPTARSTLLPRRASSDQLYTGDDGSEHSSGKDSGQGGHDEPAGADPAGSSLLVAVAAESDDEGVGGTPLMDRRPRVLTTFQGAVGAGPAGSLRDGPASRESLQTVVPRHLLADRRLAKLADGAVVVARARSQPTEV
ncbi:leucine-rich repeats and immunoglobulin-like domains protein 3 isoform X1 [Amphibalanus amphitrite]|uniref:leucine-rich repeats and immunoglobulin-like domains protein 3 isoform X1 n=1 Tax=Amphibalanus amphitrite TaxID=1232801 RepID=UPI001C906DC4|nr:leucine-rich repeats and immunoglobulin-like domains protein 3 isoform X1 [Amphibalanus amphitrite]XP_043239900.1 leucine-rich repeats and immunoglobulin-like domains protein 3 isoform X1 [Amphibalanus amphitrite]